jgi:hypothetical protein
VAVDIAFQDPQPGLVAGRGVARQALWLRS